MRVVPRVALLVVICCWAAPVLAGIPASERVPVTDPTELVAMGFSPDATGVFVWAPRAERPARIAEPESYGLGMDYATVSAFDFFGGDNGFLRGIFNSHAVYCESGGDYSWAHAALDLPDGAAIQSIRFWGYDGSTANGMQAELYETCLPDDTAGPPVNTNVFTTGTLASGDPGDFTYLWPVDPPLTVDMKSCYYNLKIRMSSNNLCQGEVLRIQKATIAFTRQISPAPAAATFNDVATNHWAFQHVEALAASGITAGCGGSNFCPDAPLTRAQMAVFLSKALGLYWSLATQ